MSRSYSLSGFKGMQEGNLSVTDSDSMSYSLSGFKGMQGTESCCYWLALRRTALAASKEFMRIISIIKQIPVGRTALAASKECRFQRRMTWPTTTSYSLSGFKGMQGRMTMRFAIQATVVQP